MATTIEPSVWSHSTISSWLHSLNPFTRRRRKGEREFCYWDAPRLYKRRELAKATRNFSLRHCFDGKGGYGHVFKAVFPSGSEAAVKVLIAKGTSNLQQRSFAAELATLGNLRHRNLVLFKGWCLTETELLLVYDYMPNKSLDLHLFLSSTSCDDVLSWSTRCRIARGVANGLVYLHDVAQVVHRDIKSANVLLDSEFNAHIADFGLARRMFSCYYSYNSVDPSYSSIFHDETLGDGTYGYIAPECIGAMVKPTPMSDVFSFGVLLFEILSARKVATTSGHLLVDWIHSLFSENRLLAALDPQLTLSSVDIEEVLGLFNLGLHCTQLEAGNRLSMRQVLRLLHDLSNILPPQTQHKPDFYALILKNSMLDIRMEGCSALLVEEDRKLNLQCCSSLVRAPQAFQWEHIIACTNNFLDLIRHDRATIEYCGEACGQLVAVKVSRETCPDWNIHILKAKPSVNYIDWCKQTLQTELQFVGSIRHVHILKLIGWSAHPVTRRRALVYEYMPNGSLLDWLYNKSRIVLPWNVRFRIAKELGSALFHLHESCLDMPIIHRNVNPSKILLDSEFHIRLADLGIGVMASSEESDNIIGTIGYIDPEYIANFTVTKYADVYAYGIILLQLVTRKLCHALWNDILFMLEWEGIQDDIKAVIPVDIEIKGAHNDLELNLLIGLGLLCIRPRSEDRPDMRRVLDILDFQLPLDSPLITRDQFRNDIIDMEALLIVNQNVPSIPR